MHTSDRDELMQRFAHQDETRQGAIDQLINESLARGEREAEVTTCPDCGGSWTAPVLAEHCDCGERKVRLIRELIDSRGLPDDHAWAYVSHSAIRAILDGPSKSEHLT